ncbi:MAG: DUF1385 domain-containing protein [Dehalococcoidia bacterium]
MKKENPFSYGGQAVMGGVMIRGRNSFAIAVRKMDGGIEISSQPLATLYKGKWRNVPLVRGIIMLIETVALGTSALMYSARVSTETEDEKITSGMIWGSIVIGVVLAVALFFIFPLLLVRAFDAFIASSFLSNVIEGVIRIILFIVYLVIIGRMSDIREIFAYHGAEHMSVNAYEADVPLSIERVRDYSTAHTRCGTSFLLVVLVIAVVVFALLGRPPIWLGIISRIVLIPVIAAVSYELLKFEAKYSHNRLVRWFLVPGLWLQALTTRQPSDRQLEVGIAAMKKALETDGVYPDDQGRYSK